MSLRENTNTAFAKSDGCWMLMCDAAREVIQEVNKDFEAAGIRIEIKGDYDNFSEHVNILKHSLQDGTKSTIETFRYDTEEPELLKSGDDGLNCGMVLENITDLVPTLKEHLEHIIFISLDYSDQRKLHDYYNSHPVPTLE